MGLRPASARWFEVLVPKEALTATLECLAGTGRVELQAHSDTAAPMTMPDLSSALESFAVLTQKYQTYWPAPAAGIPATPEDPDAMADKALRRLRAWAARADPLIQRSQAIIRRIGDLELLRDLVDYAHQGLPDLSDIARAGPVLVSRLFVLPPDAQVEAVPPAVLLQRIPAHHRNYLLVLGPREQVETLDKNLTSQKGRPVELPDWLPADPAVASTMIGERLTALAGERVTLEKKTARLNRRFGVAESLRDFTVLEWLVRNVPALPLTEHFAWVTGWSGAPDDKALEAALLARNIPCLLRFPGPPPGLDSPMLLSNPRWVRPFELFSNLLGVPGATEADPSKILALIAPLMFGFMFGDVGHGLILLIGGVMLRKRVPALALLIPGGVMATAFGFLFGSVFAREDIIPALWLHPLSEPVLLLAITLAFGATLLLLGLILDGLQEIWSGRAHAWWYSRAGLILCYLGLLLTPFEPRALLATIFGAVWVCTGSAYLADHSGWAAAGKAAAELFEALLQLIVNTISFVRIGAFALAHAGLSAAVIGVGDAAGGFGYYIVMILGNAVIIALEGLVVGIQTTRLVLFEFFIRFLRGGGRPFRPLPALESSQYEARRRHS